MKRILSLITILCITIGITSCTKHDNINYKNITEVKGFEVLNELPFVKLTENDYASFCEFLDYDNIECPYSELFDIETAMAEKESRTFDVSEHTYNFFENSHHADADKLYEVVSANNEQYMETFGKYFNKKLSDSKLKECCEIVADTLNWGIENIDGLDIDELGCILGNLKILRKDSSNFAEFNYKKDIMNISPDMIELKEERSGNENIYELMVSHETMHMLQSHCTDIEQSEDDFFIGTSYSFGNLEMNPLKNSWLYEASAELNATLHFDSEPTTYQYMINNLESISLATILNDNVKARQLEMLSFTQDAEKVYKQLEFKNETKAAEFLYVVELMRKKPDDFKTVYESKYGAVEDYSEFVKTTYEPYFAEVVSKLLYKNIAYQLTQNDMSLNDVFYVISLYELDLLKDIPLNNATVREQYSQVYEQYVDLQKTFFGYIQKYTDVDVESGFAEYQINYETDSVYANALLEGLNPDKKEYLLFRNNVLFDESYKHIISL